MEDNLVFEKQSCNAKARFCRDCGLPINEYSLRCPYCATLIRKQYNLGGLNR